MNGANDANDAPSRRNEPTSGRGAVSTHVLDTTRGQPAAGVAVEMLHHQAHLVWHHLTEAVTDADGRIASLLPEDRALETGTYRLVLRTGAYFEGRGIAAFHPEITIDFEVRDADAHHHVPVLLSPFGYTTYRGS